MSEYADTLRAAHAALAQLTASLCVLEACGDDPKAPTNILAMDAVYRRGSVVVARVNDLGRFFIPETQEGKQNG